ncbi:MAG: hemolysin family protein [Saprospiraceae bacterium]|nr:hemolysin family protein [Saprospiraceae bacterium]
MIGWLTVLIIFLALSAFFSGMEMAFISASKLKIELSRNQGKRAGRLLAYFQKSPSRFIGTYLVGNNIALVLFGIAVSKLSAPLWARFIATWPTWSTLLLETLIATCIVLLFGEFLPKLAFRLNADQLLHNFAIPFTFFHALLFPFVLFVNWITKGLMRLLFKIRLTEGEQVFNEVDLEHFIKESMHHNEDDDIDAELLGNALDLRDVKVRECMIPRPEISAIEVAETIETLTDTFIDSGFSKILVFKDHIDNVLGYVHHFDLHNSPKGIGNMIKPMPVVPESMFAQTLLSEFKKKGRTMALVVDEYGGTAGIITFEDILEEIFGEIKDEHDEEDFIEQQLAKNEFLFSGRLEIDYLNEVYDIGLPEDGDFETLSGFIIHLRESIPEMNETISTENFDFSVLNVSNTKVETVKLTIKEL